MSLEIFDGGPRVNDDPGQRLLCADQSMRNLRVRPIPFSRPNNSNVSQDSRHKSSIWRLDDFFERWLLDGFEFRNNPCTTGDCLGDDGAFPCFVPEVFKCRFVGVGLDVDLRFDLRIAWRALVA